MDTTVIDIDEPKLIAELRAEVPTAQRQLWDIYSDPLTEWIFARGAKSDQDAEEIMHDAFLRAYRGIKRFKGRSKLKTWLFKLARNAAIDYYRSPKNESLQRHVDVSEISDVWSPSTGRYKNGKGDETTGSSRRNLVDPASPQFDDLIQREASDRLHRLMSQLQGDYREVLFLRWIKGFNVEETADILGKSADAVKMSAMRALRALQKPVTEDPYFGDGGRFKEATLS